MRQQAVRALAGAAMCVVMGGLVGVRVLQIVVAETNLRRLTLLTAWSTTLVAAIVIVWSP